ncbi:MAG: hypothetical protein ABJA81_06930 [Nocardioidaceae bacterium]
MDDTTTGKIVATVLPAIVMVIAMFMILEQPTSRGRSSRSPLRPPWAHQGDAGRRAAAVSLGAMLVALNISTA